MPLETEDGQIIQVEFISNVYMVDDKKVIQCNVRGTTQRRQREEALRLALIEQGRRNHIENILLSVSSDEEMSTDLLQVIIKATQRMFGAFGYLDGSDSLVVSIINCESWEKP